MTLTPRQSWLAFGVLAVLALSWAYAIHRFEPVFEPDSNGYLRYEWSSLRSVLENRRTFAYPLFLAGIRTLADDPRAIPLAHGLAAVCAAFVVMEGLVSAGYRRSTALCCAGTLLWGRALIKLCPNVTADSLACSLAIAAAGCFLATTAASSRRRDWFGLIVFTFFAFQTRPAYLFLIPLWPILGLAADWLILRRDAGLGTWLRRAGYYAAATLVPFVLFCSLRWALVGHWGLVSFGGYNLIGIVGQFLEPEDVDGLPAELQPVASGMLASRAQVPDYNPPTNFRAMEQTYNPTIWQMAVPTIHEIHGENPVVVNRLLNQLSGELLRRHRWEYFRWLIWNSAHAAKQVVLLTATDHGVGLLMLLFLLVQFRLLWRGPGVVDGSAVFGEPAEWNSAQQIRFCEGQLLLWTAIAFTAAKSLLVILVEPANDRYITGAMPLLPAAFAVFVLADRYNRR